MPLPELIEIVPLEKPVSASIAIPGSKSITNRALILAALADGEVTIKGALWSEDTQAMVECLQRLGFEIAVEADPAETSNRRITVAGLGGEIPKAGTEAEPLGLFVENAGTAARFLAAFLCLGKGVYRLSGIDRMHERPQAELFAALRELGYRLDSETDRLPVTIHGAGPLPGECRVSIEKSSQFASALLLCAKQGEWRVEIDEYTDDGVDTAAGSNSPYVAMTEKLIAAFPNTGGTFHIEPDASSGSYFQLAAWIANCLPGAGLAEVFQSAKSAASKDGVSDEARRMASDRARLKASVAGWPESDWQIDARFTDFRLYGLATDIHEISRQTDLGDSILTAMMMAPFASHPIRFTHLGRLRLQECERVAAMRTELSKCGVEVVEDGDSLIVEPSVARIHGAEIDTYNDHRIAMCFATLGLKVPGIKIKNPACVKKTFPNFFQKLAAPPPNGLGVGILDATGETARSLPPEDLFAD
jgi:3-phosphoshikimate 1-carboxyvinyltransferase